MKIKVNIDINIHFLWCGDLQSRSVIVCARVSGMSPLSKCNTHWSIVCLTKVTDKPLQCVCVDWSIPADPGVEFRKSHSAHSHTKKNMQDGCISVKGTAVHYTRVYCHHLCCDVILKTLCAEVHYGKHFFESICVDIHMYIPKYN